MSYFWLTHDILKQSFGFKDMRLCVRHTIKLGCLFFFNQVIWKIAIISSSLGFPLGQDSEMR